MEAIIWSLAVIGGLGIVFGLLLGVASKKLAVKVDERVEQVRELLPGANCGGCGQPGCDGFASALVEGKASVGNCSACSAENAQKIGEILGVSVEIGEKKVARILCQGDNDACAERFTYEGVKDCRAAVLVAGGNKACRVGCIGFGSCAKVCPFGAITLDEKGIAAIDEEACTGCGKCVEACPQNGIVIMNASQKVYVACRNCQPGREVKDICAKGCIGCGICEKNCPFDAIHVENNLAKIDYDKCKSCGICVKKCPKGCILTTKKAAQRPTMAQEKNDVA